MQTSIALVQSGKLPPVAHLHRMMRAQNFQEKRSPGQPTPVEGAVRPMGPARLYSHHEPMATTAKRIPRAPLTLAPAEQLQELNPNRLRLESVEAERESKRRALGSHQPREMRQQGAGQQRQRQLIHIEQECHDQILRTATWLGWA